jgi:hypothetical protein
VLFVFLKMEGSFVGVVRNPIEPAAGEMMDGTAKQYKLDPDTPTHP